MRGQDDYFCIGYREGGVMLPDPVPVNPKAKIMDLGLSFDQPTLLGRTLGPRVLGFTPPMADAMDQRTLLAGAKFRFARAHVKPDRRLLKELALFVLRFCEMHLDPLCEEITFEDYIENSHYSRVQKDHYWKIYEECGDQVPTNKTYKSFGKVERMRDGTKYKHVRCINPPPDEWKVYAGPYIHAIEKVVCRLKYFAKYIPVMERPRAISELFSGHVGPFWVTDYTSFESSFSPEIIRATESVMYSYMLKDHPERARVINSWNEGTHKCRFKQFKLSVPGVRMSGDPNTSLGNGWTNLMLTAFMAYKQGLKFEGLVEGDDGLFCFDGTPDFTLCAKLGFQLKFEPHDTIYTTSFCGLMLSRSLAAFADPRYVIAAFGWTHSSYRFASPQIRKGLLRSKALSLLYCNPRCPLLTALAWRFIDLTEGVVAVDSTSYWDQHILRERREYSEALAVEYAKGISTQDREDFDDLYHISIEDQLILEAYLSSAEIAPLEHPLLQGLYDDHWVFADYDTKFCGARVELE